MRKPYCPECRRQVSAILHLLVMRNGRPAARGNCVECKSDVITFLGREDLEVEFQEPERSENLIELCGVLQRQVAAYLATHSWELYRLPADYFEKIVAEILASYGFKVQLKVRLLDTKSGDEADIIAFTHVRGADKPIGYVVECKRFAPHRKVDLKIATRLFGLKMRHAEAWGLDRALLATTSSVTTEVKREYGDRWDFEIREHEQIVDWLKAYPKSEGGLYLPKQGLAQPAVELTLTNLSIGQQEGSNVS